MDDKIFRVSKNKVRAEALKEMAEERLSDVKKETKTYKIVEQYYEVIKEIITSLMYLDGFKTLSHKTLVDYINNNYKEFSREEVILIDELRKLRNNIIYYGEKIDDAFLANKEPEIKIIIDKLVKIIDRKLKENSK